MRLESLIAPTLDRMRQTGSVPKRGSNDHANVISFIALQLQRTTVAAQKINDSTDQLMKIVLRERAKSQGVDLTRVEIGLQHPVMLAMLMMADLLPALSDLRLLLAEDPESQFIASDNPVWKYNQYCQKIRYMGILGALQRGLQIFLPLSPRYVLVLYDAEVYRVKRCTACAVTASSRDVRILNGLQVVSADQNVYFADWDLLSGIREVARSFGWARRTRRIRVLEFPEVGGGSSLIGEHEWVPNLRMHLSFLRVRRAARRIGLTRRPMLFRQGLPPMGSHVGTGPVRTFGPKGS